MGKKKEVAYVPLNNSSSIQPIIEQKVNAIPNYEDAGVKFQGKYKVQRDSFAYELKKQDENSLSIGLSTNLAGLPAGSYTINRGNPSKNLVLQFMVVSYHLTGNITSVSLVDGQGSNALSVTFPPGSSVTHSEIVPKTFLGETLTLVLGQNIPANEFIRLNLYGWYEDK